MKILPNQQPHPKPNELRRLNATAEKQTNHQLSTMICEPTGSSQQPHPKWNELRRLKATAEKQTRQPFVNNDLGADRFESAAPPETQRATSTEGHGRKTNKATICQKKKNKVLLTFFCIKKFSLTFFCIKKSLLTFFLH